MFDFINQISAVIYDFFKSLYQRFAQPEPAPKFFSEELRINLEIYRPTSPASNIDMSTYSMPSLNSFSLDTEALNRDIWLSSYRNSTPINEVVLSDNIEALVNPTRRNAAWFWQEPEIVRQTSEAELAVWWKRFRRQRRDETFATAVAVLDTELYATQLEHYPDVKIDADFICGISQDIMTNPVYDPAYPQQKYDLLVIESWLREHETNPCTRTPLLAEKLVYDEELKLRIDRFMTDTIQHTSSSSPAHG